MATGYDPIKAVISFKAPSPDDKPIDREKYGRGNFIWRHYRLWFQEELKGDDKFYVYQTELNSNGTELRPGKPIVVESDSRGRFNPDNETGTVQVSDVEKLFPKWFGPKGPKLFPDDAVTYVNQDEDGKEYDKKSFLKNFHDESYTVVDKTSILKDIKGEPVSRIPPEKSPNPEDKTASFRGYVRAAREKAFPGGFNIMRKFQEKERKKQEKDKVVDRSKEARQNDPRKYYKKRRMLEELKVQDRAPQRYPDPQTYSDGFGVVRKWQRQHGSHATKDPNEFEGGFDIVRKWQRQHGKAES